MINEKPSKIRRREQENARSRPSLVCGANHNTLARITRKRRDGGDGADEMEGKENKKEPTPNGDLSAAQPSAKRKRSIEADAPQHTAFASSPPSPMPQDEEENDDGSTSREGSSNGNGNENGNDEEEGHNARSKKVARLEARVAELEEENALYRCILETQEVLVVGTHYFFLRLYPFRDIIDFLLGVNANKRKCSLVARMF